MGVKMSETLLMEKPVYQSKDPSENENSSIPITKEGLQHPRAMFFLILWYLFSAITLFLNKHILSYYQLNPFILCEYFIFSPVTLFLNKHISSNF